MKLFKNLFGKVKGQPIFDSVQNISVKDFNTRHCPNCNSYKALEVDEYEKIPVAICKYCNSEFTPR